MCILGLVRAYVLHFVVDEAYSLLWLALNSFTCREGRVFICCLNIVGRGTGSGLWREHILKLAQALVMNIVLWTKLFTVFITSRTADITNKCYREKHLFFMISILL